VRLDDLARDLPIARRVALVAKIGAAVEYAHQRLVVHRDLKPGNVLVDATGTPKLLDFGIAKLLAADGLREAQTRTGVALLTPEYASPEQVRGEPVTVATDVYGLGAVLYDLLVGHPPQSAGASSLETLRAICEVDAVRPSVAAPAARRELAGDLDNIVMKALQKQPGARYPSIAAFVDDLERSLDGRPVGARAASFRYRAGKLARRHRGKIALAALVVAALATATVVSMLQARRADEQARVAERETRTLLLVQARQELAAGRESRALPYLAEVLRQGEDTPTVRLLVAEASRNFQLQTGEAAVTDQGWMSGGWSPDGRAIVLTGNAGLVRVYDASFRLRGELDRRDGNRFEPVFTDEGDLAIVGHDRDVLVVDLATGALRHQLVPSVGRPDRPRGWIGVPFGLPVVDGRVATWVSMEGDIAAWDVDRGTELVAIPAGATRVTAAALSHDRRWLVIGRIDGVLIERDLVTNVERALEDGPPDVLWVRRTRDGRVIAWGAHSGRIWSASSSRPIAVLDGGAQPNHYAQLARDQATLAIGAGDGSVVVWDVHTGRRRAVAFAQSGVYGARHISLSRDGARMTTAGGDLFRVWNARTAEPQLVLESLAAASFFAGALGAWLSPDGERLLTVSATDARLWRASSGALQAEHHAGHPIYSATWSPDEKRIAFAGRGGASIRDLVTGARTPIHSGMQVVFDVVWRPDGGALAIAGDGGFALVGVDGHVRRLPHPGWGATIRFRPDGARVLSAGSDVIARIWDREGNQVGALVHPSSIGSATWSVDGARIVTAGNDGALRVWDAGTGALVHVITGGKTKVLHASLSPDGALVATGGHDGEVAIWRLDTGELVHGLEGHTGSIPIVEWSPDGALLASCSEDGTAKIWDPLTGALLVSRDHRAPIMQVTWSTDGERILTAGYTGSARVWSAARDQGTSEQIQQFAATRSPWRLRDSRLFRER
jgi:WD40 repeat protein